MSIPASACAVCRQCARSAHAVHTQCARSATIWPRLGSISAHLWAPKKKNNFYWGGGGASKGEETAHLWARDGSKNRCWTWEMGWGSSRSSLSALSCPHPLCFLPLQIFEKGLEPPFCNVVWHFLVHWHQGKF